MTPKSSSRPRDKTEGSVVVAHSNNRHDQSSPDHNRLNLAEHQVLDQNIYHSILFIYFLDCCNNNKHTFA